MKLKNLNLKPTELLAELVGTFILATVAITVANPIIVGFTLLVLVLAIGSVSGAHVNPAITFGLWSTKKITAIKMFFYWAMQFAGALFALLLSQLYQGSHYGISFASFGSLDGKIFLAELIGTAVFAFGVAAACQRDIVDSSKALLAGLALLTGLAVGGGLLGQAAQAITTSTNGSAPRVSKVDGAVLNPAIALASTEKVDQQNSMQSLTGQSAKTDTKRPASRLSWETLLGGLLGGAIGMNLFAVTAGINPFKKEEETSVAATVTKVFKKNSKKATIKK